MLGEVRTRAKLTERALARKMGCSESKISRMENGARGATEFDVITFMAHCGCPNEEIQGVLALVREDNDSYRLRPHGDQIPDDLGALIAQEATAGGIAAFEPQLIPGILQTREYARALFHAFGITPKEKIESCVVRRINRQKLLRRSEPVRFTFFVHEQAFRGVIGGSRVMQEQLLKLIFETSQDHCVIRVVPEPALVGGIPGGAFRLMRYADSGPVAYVPLLNSSLFFEEPSDVSAYQEVLSYLPRLALSGQESRHWLAELASDYERRADVAEELQRA